MSIMCMVIDDDAIARQMLSSHISQIPELILLDNSASPPEAQRHITSGQVDQIFLVQAQPGLTPIHLPQNLHK